MKLNSKLSKGFTLVELLTVTVAVAVVSMLISLVLTFSLRGNNKTGSINQVRQNGNYAVLQMSKMVGYAKSFDGVSTDGVSYSSNCVVVLSPSPTPAPAPSQYNYIKITNFDGGQTVFSCSPFTIASNGASLIDTNSIAIDAGSCWFTCVQNRITNVPIIGINLSLSKKTTGVFTEDKVSIPFQTSITMRNLGR